MNSKLKLTVKSIAHSGVHIGRDITLKVSSSELGINFEIKKNVLPDKTTVLNIELYNLEVEISKLDIPLTVTVIERDALFNDKGSMYKRLYINTDIAAVSEHIVTVNVYENRLFFWRKPAKFDMVFEVEIIQDKDVPRGVNTLKQYTYKGINGTEDYNQHDDIILQAVACWNTEFANDTNPPTTHLDPNLVKAMLYQETRVGNDPFNNGLVNIMQVGNVGDPSISTLRGELPEYWIHNGELIKLEYDAKVETPYDSVFWGVRWLYHKAKPDNTEPDRKWKGWKEAVNGYGPGKVEYIENVWNIYTNGVSKRDGGIKIWSVAWLLLAPLFLFLTGMSDDQIRKGAEQFIDVNHSFMTGIDMIRDSADSSLLAVVGQDSEDWSEWTRVGRIEKGVVNWFPDMAYGIGPAGGILSARFLHLKGFENPIFEVFSQTHKHNGSVDLYQIENDNLKPLFRACAVDGYHDRRWDPEGYPELGGGWQGSCSVYYKDGRLQASYRDVNNDGVDDVVLTGTQQIFCSHRYDEEEQLVKEKEIYEEYILRPDQYQNPKQCVPLNNFF